MPCFQACVPEPPWKWNHPRRYTFEIPVLGRQRQADPWDLPACQSHLRGKLQAMRDPIANKHANKHAKAKWMAREEWQLRLFSDPTCVCLALVYTNMRVCTNMHIYTKYQHLSTRGWDSSWSVFPFWSLYNRIIPGRRPLVMFLGVYRGRPYITRTLVVWLGVSLKD